MSNFFPLLFTCVAFILSTCQAHPGYEECERKCTAMDNCFTSKYDETSDSCSFISKHGVYIPFIASIPPQTEPPMIYLRQETTPVEFAKSSEPTNWTPSLILMTPNDGVCEHVCHTIYQCRSYFYDHNEGKCKMSFYPGASTEWTLDYAVDAVPEDYPSLFSDMDHF